MIWMGPAPRTNEDWRRYIEMCLGEGDSIQGIIDRERADAVEEATSGSQFARTRDLKATIADLRAVLAPLLDEPYRSDEGQPFCVWCHLWHPYGREEHAPDCPVLRRDELLGR